MPIGTVDWIAAGMLDGSIANVVDEDSMNIIGFRFGIRNQFFHGAHPLGWIRGIRLQIDGKSVAPESVFFMLREQPFPLWQVSLITDVWWRPRETAYIQIDQKDGLTAGEHNIVCEMDLSTFFFTPAIDRRNLYPTLQLRLEQTMTLQEHKESRV